MASADQFTVKGQGKSGMVRSLGECDPLLYQHKTYFEGFTYCPQEMLWNKRSL